MSVLDVDTPSDDVEAVMHAVSHPVTVVARMKASNASVSKWVMYTVLSPVIS